MLLLGKQYTQNDNARVGGVIRLFEQFKDELDNNSVDYEVIDLNWRNYAHPLWAYVLIVTSILVKVPKFGHISFHGTANEFVYLSPLVVFLAKIFNRNVSLRKFAGHFDVIYRSSGFIKRFLVTYALRNTDFLFFETKELVKFFRVFNSNTYWFPNVRSRSISSVNGEERERQGFVFIGHIKETKGIDHIIDVSKVLGLSVDFYGPIESKSFESRIVGISCLKYKGVLDSSDVPNVLSRYRALILPTYHPGEGYPGVIVEAYSVGTPVIASRWGGIPEILESGVHGVMVEPKNTESLMNGVKYFEELPLEELSRNSLEKFDEFDSSIVTKKILKLMLK